MELRRGEVSVPPGYGKRELNGARGVIQPPSTTRKSLAEQVRGCQRPRLGSRNCCAVLLASESSKVLDCSLTTETAAAAQEFKMVCKCWRNCSISCLLAPANSSSQARWRASQSARFSAANDASEDSTLLRASVTASSISRDTFWWNSASAVPAAVSSCERASEARASSCAVAPPVAACAFSPRRAS